MCHVLAVSESGYYKFEKNPGKPDRDTLLLAKIKKILDESVFNDYYGVPRMKIALFNKGISVGTRKLTRLMRRLVLIHEHKRRPKCLTKATTDIQEKENLVNQDFSSEAPFKKGAYRYLTDPVLRWQAVYFSVAGLLRRISSVIVNAR